LVLALLALLGLRPELGRQGLLLLLLAVLRLVRLSVLLLRPSKSLQGLLLLKRLWGGWWCAGR
jgi:hypothetical protein